MWPERSWMNWKVWSAQTILDRFYRNVYHRLNHTLDVDLHGFDFFYTEGVTTIRKRRHAKEVGASENLAG